MRGSPDGKEWKKHQYLEDLKIGQLTIRMLYATKATAVQIDPIKQADVSITILRRFSLKKN